MFKPLSLSLVAAAVMLAGCGSKNDATEKNFARTISEQLDQSGFLCIGSIHGSRPLDFPSAYSNSIFTSPLEAPTSSRLKALQEAGFIKGSPGSGPFVSGPGTVFSLTDAGRKMATNMGQQNPATAAVLGEKTAAFCYGKLSLAKVVNWQSPDAAHESNVQYTYKVSLVEPWASNATLVSRFPEIADIQRGAEKEVILAPMVQTQDGWRFR